ncbi:MAG: hypothetical protein ABIL58_07615 [Pseudomonadota bacterium]
MNISASRAMTAAVSALWLLFAASWSFAGECRPHYSVVDNHIHYLDFVQKTDGFAALIHAMDLAGVEQAVVFGMPMVKLWGENDPIAPTYYLDTDSRAYYYGATDYILAAELVRQPESVRQRLHPFICGINPLDMNAADHIERLLQLYPGFWKGIGELMSRHDDLTAFTYGEPPRADHPALMRVYRLTPATADKVARGNILRILGAK